MQYHWQNHANNKKLIVFFTGWSFDENPFKFLVCQDFDVLIFYDYNTVESDFDYGIFDKYSEKYLLSWSMGVYIAYLLKDNFTGFSKRIAINGTIYPVDDIYGIPEKPFMLTLKHAQKGLEGKFYKNIFNNPDEYERYLKFPIKRDINNRVTELENLYKLIINTTISNDKFYDYAYISTNDKIIPTNNQLRFWNESNISYQLLESGHFPYYNFESWNDLLCF